MGALTAGLIAGGVAATAAIASSAVASSAAGDAANTAADYQTRANEISQAGGREALDYMRAQGAQGEQAIRQGFQGAQGVLQPYADMQLRATQGLEALTDPNNPIYQAQRGRMTEAIQRQLAAQGLLRSKNQVDLLSNLEIDLERERVGRIAGLANMGAAQGLAGLQQGLGSSLGQFYQNQGGQIGSSIAGLANSRAQGLAALGQIYSGNQAQQGQIWGNAIQGVGNAFQGALGNYGAIQNQNAQMGQLQMLLGGQKPYDPKMVYAPGNVTPGPWAPWAGQ